MGEKLSQLTEKYPRPPPIFTNLNLTQATRQQPTKRATQRRRTIEQPAAQQHLMPAIEKRQVNNDTSQNATLEQPQQRTTNNQASETLGESHKRAHKPPQRDQRGQVHAGTEALDEPVRRYVGDDVRDVEDEQGSVILGAFEGEVGRQACDICIANIGAIDEGEEPGAGQ